MNKYEKQAVEFLKKTNSICKIEFGGVARNENWKEKDKRNWYDVTITTPVGSMNFVFWDSIHNTEISLITFEEYVKKQLHCNWIDLTYGERVKMTNELTRKKKECRPTEYDVLACLQKYDVGTFEDFCSEFGYDEDSRLAERIYFAVQKEYHDLSRIFSKEELEELREIQ